MKIKSIVNFENITEREEYDSNSSQYKELMKIDDENGWKDYTNEMLSKGISVIYDALDDLFVAKPINFPKTKIKESMEFYSVKETLLLEGYQFSKKDNDVLFKFLNEAIKQKVDFNELTPTELLREYEEFKEDFNSSLINSEVPKKKTIGNAPSLNKGKELLFDEELNTSEAWDAGHECAMQGCGPEENPYDEFDQAGEFEQWNQGYQAWAAAQEEPEVMDYMQEAKEEKKKYGKHRRLIESLENDFEDEDADDLETEEEVDTEVTDEDIDDDDIDVETSESDLAKINGSEEEIEEVPEESEEEVNSDIDSNLLDIETLKSIVAEILAGNPQTAPQATGGAPAAGPTTSAITDPLASDTSVIEQSVVPQGPNVTNSEFQEIQGNISNLQNKIDNDPSYIEVLEGNPGTEEEIQLNEDQYEDDDYETANEDSYEIVNDKDLDFVKENGGQTPDFDDDGLATVTDFEEPVEDEEALEDVTSFENDSVPVANIDGNVPGVIGADATPLPQVGEVDYKGSPVKVVITGWLITEAETKFLAEAVSKSNAQLKKITSKDKDSMTLFVEKNSRLFKVDYNDRPKVETLEAWSIGKTKFTSLKEAIKFGANNKETVSQKDRFFKKLVTENKDVLNRNISNSYRDTDIFENFDEAKSKYKKTLSVKRTGQVNLKTGINEVFSNITQIAPSIQNTLVKVGENYMLIKGNLKEGIKVNDVALLIDINSKNYLGECKVVGLFDNSPKGLQKISEITKKSQLPLLVWK